MTITHEQTWKHDKPMYRDYEANIPAGPWDDEPDKAQWIDGDTDLDCLAVRNGHGAWCGYVGVPSTHPLHSKGNSGMDEDLPPLQVHGGITFTGSCNEEAPEGHGVCHIPLPGRDDNVWWIGFDTAHHWDTSPGLMATSKRIGIDSFLPDEHTSYKTLGYVQAECAQLAEQLKALANG